MMIRWWKSKVSRHRHNQSVSQCHTECSVMLSKAMKIEGDDTVCCLEYRFVSKLGGGGGGSDTQTGRKCSICSNYNYTHFFTKKSTSISNDKTVLHYAKYTISIHHQPVWLIELSSVSVCIDNLRYRGGKPKCLTTNWLSNHKFNLRLYAKLLQAIQLPKKQSVKSNAWQRRIAKSSIDWKLALSGHLC